MSENDFIIVDEEETNKEDNKQDTGREEEKKEVTTSDHSEKDDDGYERICFICHRPESVTGKMVELPNNIAVCPDCMQRSFDMMNNSSMDLSSMMNIPGVHFMNLSDLENMQPKAQKIKKKKNLSSWILRRFRHRIRSKHVWMNISLDRSMQRKQSLLLFIIIISV